MYKQMQENILEGIGNWFDNTMDDITLRMLVLTKPDFMRGYPINDMMNPRNPYWLMRATLSMLAGLA